LQVPKTQVTTDQSPSHRCYHACLKGISLDRTNIYEALQHPPPGMLFADQFAFRPTGSTDAALITLLHTIYVMLSTHDRDCYPHTHTISLSVC